VNHNREKWKISRFDDLKTFLQYIFIFYDELILKVVKLLTN